MILKNPRYALRRLTDDLLQQMIAARGALAKDERAACILALTAAGAFVHRLAERERRLRGFHGPSPDEPLTRLIKALQSLEHGAVDPLLEPNSGPRITSSAEGDSTVRGRRPRLTANVLEARAMISSAISLLMMAGRSGRDAAAAVAALLKDEPILAASSGQPLRTVMRWREDILALGERLDLAEMDAEVSPERMAAAKYNFVLASVRRLLDAGACQPADLEKMALQQLQHGRGLLGMAAGKSGFAWAKPGKS